MDQQGAVLRGQSGLAVRDSSPMEFTEVQRRLIRDAYANGAGDEEFAVLMEIARARRLNPLLRQIHFVSRWDGEKHRPVWAAQVSIDGLRAIAERTGLYAGQDEPEFVENPDGTLKLCRVRVWRRDWPRPAVGVAYWSEYCPMARDRTTGKSRPTAMWARMPHVMLAKTAESVALRKAFPEDMSGLYTSEEMGNAPGTSPAQPPAVAPAQATVVQRVETRVEERVSVPGPTAALGPLRVVSSNPANAWLDYLG
jgi:phage recombination protein Bet